MTDRNCRNARPADLPPKLFYPHFRNADKPFIQLSE
jgi:hypothetical protein